MLFNKKKIITVIICAILALSGCKPSDRQINEKLSAPPASDNLEISILDVGKADAMILKTKEHTVIIDCGEKGDGKEILSRLSADGRNFIDCLFITHFDKDHVGGARRLINDIEIGKIITPKYSGNSDEYFEYLDALREKEITPTELVENMSFVIDDCLFEVYPPLKSSYNNDDNDFSLVISVTHGENKLLFAGDAEAERLSELSAQLNLKHDFLKVPHHGNYNTNTKSFLKSVGPEYAVITCSDKNPASDEVISYLDYLNCATYLTQNGDIDIISNGKEIEISQP